MNHTNKIECRQNENNKTTTTISLFRVSEGKFGIQFVCFSFSLILTWCQWCVLARSVAIHSHRLPLYGMHRYTKIVVGYTHTSHQVVAAFSFYVVRLCMPFVFRRAWADWNSGRYCQFQQNTCTELLLYHVRSPQPICSQFHRIDSWNFKYNIETLLSFELNHFKVIDVNFFFLKICWNFFRLSRKYRI